jgi:uncharacterized protein
MKSSRKLILILAYVVAILAMAGCAAVPNAYAATNDQTTNPPQRTLTAVGQGKVFLVPDVAYVTIGVHSEAATVAAALKDNNTQAQAIQKALTALGVDTKDIQTSAFNVYPQQQPNPKALPGSTDTQTVTTYAVDNTVNVTVRDLNKLGTLLDNVVSSGANTIHGVQFDALDKSKAMADARKLAIQDAKNQAQEIATDSGVQLGNIMTLNVNTGNVPGPIYAGKGGFAAADASVAVSSGQLQITADANIVYEIK